MTVSYIKCKYPSHSFRSTNSSSRLKIMNLINDIFCLLSSDLIHNLVVFLVDVLVNILYCFNSRAYLDIDVIVKFCKQICIIWHNPAILKQMIPDNNIFSIVVPSVNKIGVLCMFSVCIKFFWIVISTLAILTYRAVWIQCTIWSMKACALLPMNINMVTS